VAQAKDRYEHQDIKIQRKVLPNARRLKAITAKQVRQLLGEIPKFEPIPAYIAGYVMKKGLRFPIHTVDARIVGKKKSRKHVAISAGVGLFSPDSVRKNKMLWKLSGNGRLWFEIEPIIRTLSSPHFLANSGSLHHGKGAWKRFSTKL
jgi:hypothetical protein